MMYTVNNKNIKTINNMETRKFGDRKELSKIKTFEESPKSKEIAKLLSNFDNPKIVDKLNKIKSILKLTDAKFCDFISKLIINNMDGYNHYWYRSFKSSITSSKKIEDKILSQLNKCISIDSANKLLSELDSISSNKIYMPKSSKTIVINPIENYLKIKNLNLSEFDLIELFKILMPKLKKHYKDCHYYQKCDKEDLFLLIEVVIENAVVNDISKFSDPKTMIINLFDKYLYEISKSIRDKFGVLNPIDLSTGPKRHPNTSVYYTTPLIKSFPSELILVNQKIFISLDNFNKEVYEKLVESSFDTYMDKMLSDKKRFEHKGSAFELENEVFDKYKDNIHGCILFMINNNPDFNTEIEINILKSIDFVIDNNFDDIIRTLMLTDNNLQKTTELLNLCYPSSDPKKNPNAQTYSPRAKPTKQKWKEIVIKSTLDVVEQYDQEPISRKETELITTNGDLNSILFDIAIKNLLDINQIKELYYTTFDLLIKDYKDFKLYLETREVIDNKILAFLNNGNNQEFIVEYALKIKSGRGDSIDTNKFVLDNLLRPSQKEEKKELIDRIYNCNSLDFCRNLPSFVNKLVNIKMQNRDVLITDKNSTKKSVSFYLEVYTGVIGGYKSIHDQAITRQQTGRNYEKKSPKRIDDNVENLYKCSNKLFNSIPKLNTIESNCENILKNKFDTLMGKYIELGDKITHKTYKTILRFNDADLNTNEKLILEGVLNRHNDSISNSSTLFEDTKQTIMNCLFYTAYLKYSDLLFEKNGDNFEKNLKAIIEENFDKWAITILENNITKWSDVSKIIYYQNYQASRSADYICRRDNKIK
jgi:hypothetical protein